MGKRIGWLMAGLVVAGCRHASLRERAPASAARVDRATCAARERLLRTGLARAADFDRVVATAVDDDARVILIGVEHFNHEREAYPRLVRALKRRFADLDCFFVEEKLRPDEFPRAAEALRLLNDGRTDVPAEDLGFGPEAVDVWTGVRAEGPRVHLVDDPDVMSEEEIKRPGGDLAWVRRRNEVMADRIGEVFRAKQCHRAVYPVGALHVSEPTPATALPARLRAADLPSSSLLLVIAGRNSGAAESPFGLLGPAWQWMKRPVRRESEAADAGACGWNPPVPTRPLGFFSRTRSVPIVLDPASPDYRDFAATLVYVCQDEPKCVGFNARLRAAGGTSVQKAVDNPADVR